MQFSTGSRYCYSHFNHDWCAKDDWTPASRCVELNKWVTNPEMLDLVVYDGAYHDFDRSKGNRTYLGHILQYDDEATKDAKERTKAFFDRYLLRK